MWGWFQSSVTEHVLSQVIYKQYKQISFGQAKYSGGVIPLCWTGIMDWNGGMDYGITYFIAIPNSAV